MLVTGITQNITESRDAVTLLDGEVVGPTSNIPRSPMVQSHFPSQQQVERDGYDSDSSVDHNAAIHSEGPLEVDEPDIPEAGDPVLPTNEDQPANNSSNFVDIPEESLKKMKVSELKSELLKRGQPVFGLKAVLLERLRSALQQRLPNLSSADQVARATDDLTGFSATARWRALVPNEAAVEEPQNNTLLRAPTIPADNAEFVPQKHYFSEMFDRELFLGKEKIPKQHRNGHLVLEDGKLVWDEKVNIKGGPKMEFLEEHKLDVNSLPQEWFNAFLPIYDGKISNPHHGNTPYWTHKWANYTNKKALMLGAGVPGGMYPTFKPFSYQEIERFIALYILQGLNPSPQVEMKFNSQETDPVQGNDLCY